MADHGYPASPLGVLPAWPCRGSPRSSRNIKGDPKGFVGPDPGPPPPPPPHPPPPENSQYSRVRGLHKWRSGLRSGLKCFLAQGSGDGGLGVYRVSRC